MQGLESLHHIFPVKNPPTEGDMVLNQQKIATWLQDLSFQRRMYLILGISVPFLLEDLIKNPISNLTNPNYLPSLPLTQKIFNVFWHSAFEEKMAATLMITVPIALGILYYLNRQDAKNLLQEIHFSESSLNSEAETQIGSGEC